MSGTMRVFGKRSDTPASDGQLPAPVRTPGLPARIVPASVQVSAPDMKAEAAKAKLVQRDRLFREIIDVVDLKDLYSMETSQARTELSDVSRALLARGGYNLDMGEQDLLIQEIINDIIGLGPLESLLARDDIADIMVCGPNKIFIEVAGKLRLTDIRFRSEEQLRNVASRIVQAVGRRVDESSPICDARLKDGSRVAIVIPPIAIDGTNITIRKFRKDKLRLDDLVRYGAITPEGGRLIEIISACRLNVLVSGGTGSGKSLDVLSGLLRADGTWGRMADAKVGDMLMAPDRTPTRITGVYPQGVLPAYRLTFDGEASTRCSLDHLWKVTTGDGWFTASTLDISKAMDAGKNVSIPLMSMDMDEANPRRDGVMSRRILSFAPDGECEMQCIAVDHRDHLYVTDGYVVTHNTTLLNCLTLFIDPEESIITCEDAAELQLQQPNVRRWETRPANLEGKGEIAMAALVKASLRHRPERIIIGEVRGPEAFDLLQAMNTGHDGSAGTVHSNSPREAISRVESLIAMGGFNLPAIQVREQIVNSIDVIIQTSRLRDGSRKITHITELTGMEGDKPQLQDLMKLETLGEGVDGKLETRHVMTGVRPSFWEKARYYGLEKELISIIEKEKKR